MRCKTHLSDLSSSVGVCASCLRDRLFSLIASHAQAEAPTRPVHLHREDNRKSDMQQPPPPLFPRSVSPYVNRRGTKFANRNPDLANQLFFSTPQLGPSGSILVQNPCKREKSRFSPFPNLFRSILKRTDSDPGVPAPDSRNSSPSWFSSIFSGRKKKQSRLHSLDESSTTAGGRRRFPGGDRGMSPARNSCSVDEDNCNGGSSGYSSESSRGWRQTPQRGVPLPRRGSAGRGPNSRNMAGYAFCLSPLVRASPNRHRNKNSVPPEIALSGDQKISVKPQLSTAASFCANRSRKIADFGRVNRHH